MANQYGGSSSAFVNGITSGSLVQKAAAAQPNGPEAVALTLKRSAPAPAVTTTRQGATTNSTGGSGTNTGATVTRSSNGTTNTYVDPYARYGGTAAYNRLVGDYDAAKGVAYGSIGDKTQAGANAYGSSILDYVEATKQGQKGIDAKTVNNELARKQGSDGITDMVSHGVRSSAVRLGAGNASASSAAEQLAHAWGENGTQQMAGVNNQYELGANDIKSQQDAFDSTSNTNLRHIQESKNVIVNGIVDEATQALAALNSQAAYASLPQRVNIEAEKARIRSEALGKLQSLDGQLTNSKPAAISHEDALGQAFQLNSAGKASTTPFDISTVTPANTRSTITSNSETPLYIAPITKKTNE